MINITKNLVKNFSSREGYSPKIIVIHISAGSLTSMTSWFSTPGSQASAHYGIGKNGSILQYVEEENKAWHAGRVNNPSFELYLNNVNPNLYTIGIENEGLDLADAPKEQIESLVELIRDICKRHSIPMDRDHIIGHFEIDAINRPYCPSPDHSIMDKIVNLLDNKDSIKGQIINLLNQL